MDLSKLQFGSKVKILDNPYGFSQTVGYVVKSLYYHRESQGVLDDGGDIWVRPKDYPRDAIYCFDRAALKVLKYAPEEKKK